MTMIDIELLRLDAGSQPRAYLDATTVEDYAERMEAGDRFPPIIVFYDGTAYWPADGFHRTHAAKALGLAEIDADIRQGTQRDAILFSCGANAVHGMRRTNEDKQRAVKRLLTDDEWSKWSDRRIAEHCAVGNYMVSDWRKRLYPQPEPSVRFTQTRLVQRGDATFEMNTGGINADRSRSDYDPLAGGAGDDRAQSRYETAPALPPRPAGFRERETTNYTIRLDGIVQAIDNAMQGLPDPEMLAAKSTVLDIDKVTRWAQYWGDVEIELRDKAERAA